MQEIHVSDLKTFLQCRRKWEFSSPLRRNLEPDMPYLPFFLGRAIHHCLEEYYAGLRDSPLEALWPWVKNEQEIVGAVWEREAEKFAESVYLAEGMLQHYMIWQEKSVGDFNDDKLEFVSLEQAFSVPIRTGTGRASPKVRLAGRFDGVVRHKPTGSLWLFETKTTRSIKELAVSLANELQTGVYILAAQQLFKEPIQGVLYNMLRKKLPTAPAVLKDGMLSKNKSIDTSVEMYIQMIQNAHPGIDKQTAYDWYGDILESLATSENRRFFARIPIRRSQLELKQLAQQLHIVGLEMTNPRTPTYPAPSLMNCAWCSFRDPCLALNMQGDEAAEFLLRTSFRVKNGAQSWRLESADVNES